MRSHEKQRKLEVLFCRGHGLTPAQREVFVREHCAGDPDLAGELRELFAADQQPTNSLLGRDWTTTMGRIGAYELLKVLGEGGMGRVYLARQEEPLERLVALKTLKAGLESKTDVARFEAERQTLAAMNHPGIASVFDAGVDTDGRPYFAMEYVPGMPLTEFADQFRLTIEERLRLFHEVCEAVQHAHSKGVIHRDLKPANVLVSWQGDEMAPKIIDFGVARAVSSLGSRHMVSDATLGIRVGTLLYMSPEQIDPKGIDLDTRVDVYALGTMLYELLCGAHPFEAALVEDMGPLDIQKVLLQQDPPPMSERVLRGQDVYLNARLRTLSPRALQRRLHGELDWVVAKAMEKNRDRRYATPLALAEDLGRHLRCEPLEAAPATTLYRLGKLVRRRRTAVLAGTLVLLSLVLGLIGTTSGYLRASAARRDEARARGELEKLVVRLGSTVQMYEDTLLFASSESPEAEASVRRLLERTRSRLPILFEGREAAEASARYKLARALVLMGEVETSREELLEAYRIQKRILEDADLELFNTVSGLIYTTRLIDGFPAAEGYVTHVLSIAQQRIRAAKPSLAPQLDEVIELVRGERPTPERARARLEALRASARHLDAADPDERVIGRVLIEVGLVLFNEWEMVEGLTSLAGFAEVGMRVASASGSLETTFYSWSGLQLRLLFPAPDPATLLEAAAALTEAASALPPTHWIRIDLHRLRGLALAVAGRTAEAEAELLLGMDAVDELPGRPMALLRHTRRGLVELCALLEERGELEAFLARSLERWREDGERASPWWVVALPANPTSAWTEALVLLERPRSVPRDARERLTLGVALYRVGRFDEALSVLEEASRNTDDVAPGIFLALTQRALGNRSAVGEALERLGTSRPGSGAERFFLEELESPPR